MDFQQAEAQFAWLENQLRTGALNEQQYKAGLAQLQVTDAWGRPWMKQERTGVWHVFQNGQWMPSTPPPVAAPPAPPPAAYYPTPGPAFIQPQAAAMPTAQTKKGSSLLSKYLTYLLIWAVLWVVIAFVVMTFVVKDQPDVIFGIGAAALLSLVLMLNSLRGGWKGQVVEIRTVSESDGDGGWEDVTYAYIRETSGKVRKEKALPVWKVGDWLEKRQGEGWIRNL